MAAIRPIPYKKFEKVLKKLGCELAPATREAVTGCGKNPA
jgi:hypothetical protein